MKINGEFLDDLYWDGEEAYQHLPRIKGMSLRRGFPAKENLPHPTSTIF